MNVDPAGLSTSERYKLLIGCIVPRPIAFVSTLSPDGRHANLAPYSFFNGAASNPMTLLVCPANDLDGAPKDTLRWAAPPEEGGRGEFVVNAAVEEYALAVAAAGEDLPPEESEFELTGLEPAPSVVVAPPRVAIAPWSFECRTRRVIRLAPGEPAGGNVIIGEVVHVHVDDDLVNERWHVDPERLRAIGRMGGRAYCRTRDRFDMPVGRAALESPH